MPGVQDIIANFEYHCRRAVQEGPASRRAVAREETVQEFVVRATELA